MELKDSEDIKKHLLETNDEYRRIYRQHHEFDLQAQIEQDELEEQRLKKLKLHLKDRMEGMVAQYRTQMV